MEIRCVPSPTAYKDAAHRGLDEEAMADLIANLIWDPSRGTRTANGFLELDWRHVRARYSLKEDGDTVTIYLYRICQRPQARRGLPGAASLGRDLVVAVVTDWVKRKLAALEDAR